MTNSIGIELVEIPAGKFQMGEGGGAVAVTLTRSFWLGKTEVTRGQWEKVMGTTPWAGEAPDAELPATYVSWDDATAFCRKLTDRERANGMLQTSEVYRLPTEAEWEYACRAGTTTAYSFGDDKSRLGDFDWFGGNSGGKAHPVGTKKANPWGLYDMHGNAWEWCSDWSENKLAGGVDPVGPAVSSRRVNRGGGWGYAPVACRSAFRSSLEPSPRNGVLGLRVARGPSPPTAEGQQSAPNLPLEAVDNSVGMTLLKIPAGRFQMGEGTASVAVTRSRPYWLGKTEVTNGQWAEIMGTTPENSAVGKSEMDLPIVNVSWSEATEFCKKLTERERLKGGLRAVDNYRLPMEAEWEYACRAGTSTQFSFGDETSNLGDFAWFAANSEGRVHSVATKKPNPWGLHDMHGNVHEWCLDWWDGRLLGGTDPLGPADGSSRVGRGGSWMNGPTECRSAYRYGDAPTLRNVHLGFRVAARVVTETAPVDR